MGYTHYWKHAELPADLFAEIARDTEVIVANSPVPLAGWDGTGKPKVYANGISLNGTEPDDFETFTLTPEATESNFCKTGLRPYDVVVTAVLTRAAKLAQERGVFFELSSDGGPEGFAEGREFQEKLFAGKDT